MGHSKGTPRNVKDDFMLLLLLHLQGFLWVVFKPWRWRDDDTMQLITYYNHQNVSETLRMEAKLH